VLCTAFARGAAAQHQIAAIERPDSQNVRLTVSGSLADDYQPYYDLFPLESSSDLQHWEVTVSVLRTNSVPGPVQSLQPSTDLVRYFRTPTNACPTAFPKPSGPYQVGTVSRLFASATRNSTELGSNREFMVSIFYPATPAGWRPPQFVFEPIYGPILFAFEFVTNPRPVEVVTNLLSHALPGLPVLAGTNSFPVLLYCHGGTYFRRDNIHKLSELASHGYIVVAADYYDACYSYLPDGTLVTGTENLSGYEQTYSVVDTQFLLDRLEQMNASDPMFAGRFDLSRIGVIGWSFGGAVAGDVCRLDPRVRAAVLYDAAFWAAPGLSQAGLDKPFLCINATVELVPGWSAPAIDLFNRATHDAMFFQVAGTQHTDFSDIILMDYPGVTELQRTTLIVDYTRAFFNHYLLGTTEPLLNAPSTNSAVIVNWMKK
jgi:dienelactone hydrolase